MSDLIKTQEIGDCKLQIFYDHDAGCPCMEWDLAGLYLFEYSDNHCLHRDCDWREWASDNRHSLEEILRDMADKFITQREIVKYIKDGNINGLRFIYDRHEREWHLQYQCDWGINKGIWFTQKSFAPYELRSEDYRMEIIEELEQDDLVALIRDCAKDIVFREWSSTGYSQGDYLYGVAYMTKEQFDKRCGFNSQKYKDWKEQAEEIIDGELKCIEMWAWGDVKGFTLEKKVYFTKQYKDGKTQDSYEWEDVDSCWGYYLETDELIKEIMCEHNLKEE